MLPDDRYPWGTCHVMETAHSDNTYLQCLLLEVGFQDVKNEMKARYKAFVEEQVNGYNNRPPYLEKYRRSPKAGTWSRLHLHVDQIVSPTVSGSIDAVVETL